MRDEGNGLTGRLYPLQIRPCKRLSRVMHIIKDRSEETKLEAYDVVQFGLRRLQEAGLFLLSFLLPGRYRVRVVQHLIRFIP